jgi:hypothetical protein
VLAGKALLERVALKAIACEPPIRSGRWRRLLLGVHYEADRREAILSLDE